jgi:hypothetical protein
MPAPTQTSAVVNVNNGGATSTVTLSGVVAGASIVVVVPAFRFSTPGAALVTGVSSSNGGALALSRSRLRNSDNGGNQHRLGLHVYTLLNAAAGSHTLTVTFANGSGNYADWFAMEVPGLKTTGALDATASADNAFAHPVSSVSITSGGLAQAQSFVLAVACGVAASAWNGSTTAPYPAPAGGGWTALRGARVSGSLAGVPFQSAYLDTSSVAAVSATWTVPNDSTDDGYITMAVVFGLASGSSYIEILTGGTTINGTTGWTVQYSAADPKLGYAEIPNVAAQATGNELRVPAPAGTTVGQSINVQAFQASPGTLSTTAWGVGTVRAGA